MRQSVKQSNVKVWFPSGLFVGVLAALLLLRPPVASTQEPAATPPPLDTRPDALPPTVILSNVPGPSAAPDKEKTPPVVQATPTHARIGGPQFQGALTCSSSLCHGGGSAERNAYTIWNRSDQHHRSAATLTSQRAMLMAKGAGLSSSAGSVDCTVCHEPLAGVPDERLPAALDVRSEGVTCESCHGAAQNWMRSHTRRDFTHAQNVQTGVRELRGLYARANACVACHQVISTKLLAAGHPSLIFELDEQMEKEPRHWTIDTGDYYGPRAWLTGQAVALREMSWSLNDNAAPGAEEREQWRALVWLLQRTVDSRGGDGKLPGFDDVPNPDAFIPGNVARARGLADNFARAASELDWSRESVRRCLDGLAATDKEFAPVVGPEEQLAMRLRGQRLHRALTRLVVVLRKKDEDKWKPAMLELAELYVLSERRVIFDGAAYADHLRRFRAEAAKVAAD